MFAFVAFACPSLTWSVITQASAAKLLPCLLPVCQWGSPRVTRVSEDLSGSCAFRSHSRVKASTSPQGIFAAWRWLQDWCRVCSSGASPISSHRNHVVVSYKSVWAIPRQSYDLFLVCDPDSNDVYQKMKIEALHLESCQTPGAHVASGPPTCCRWLSETGDNANNIPL